MIYIKVGVVIEFLALIWLIIEYFGIYLDDHAHKYLHIAGVCILWLMIIMISLITLSEVI